MSYRETYFLKILWYLPLPKMSYTGCALTPCSAISQPPAWAQNNRGGVGVATSGGWGLCRNNHMQKISCRSYSGDGCSPRPTDGGTPQRGFNHRPHVRDCLSGSERHVFKVKKLRKGGNGLKTPLSGIDKRQISHHWLKLALPCQHMLPWISATYPGWNWIFQLDAMQ